MMDYLNNLDPITYLLEPLGHLYYYARAHPFKALFTAFLAHRFYLIIYRLYFHPLGRLGVPGPFLAKITSLYEFYYDFLASPTNGQLQFHITDTLHPQYGSIVRTHPDKVRINDLSAYRTIHAVGSKFTKDPLFYQHFGIAQSSAFMVDVAEHKKRRAIMAPLFAKKEIVRLEGMMRGKVRKLRERLEREVGEGEREWELHCEMQAVAGDVVMEFAYGESDDMLTNKPFNESNIMFSLADNAIEKTPIGKYSPALKWITSSLIARLTDILLPSSNISSTYKAQQRVFARVKSIRRQHESGLLKQDSNTPITLFSELLHALPSDRALAEEALLIYFAGMDTTSFALSRAFHFLAANPSIQEKVFSDVKAVWPDRSSEIPTYTEFEKKEYFSAFLKEVYRLSYGVSGALPRIVPPGGAQLGKFYFPGGTRVETCNYSISHHPELWGGVEAGKVFDPERWLREGSKEEEKWIVNFGVGSRQCMGMHFAVMEIVLVVATVVRGFELRLEGEEGEMRWVDKWLPINRGKWEVLVKRREEKGE